LKITCPGLLWITIFLISASWVAGASTQHLATLLSFKMQCVVVVVVVLCVCLGFGFCFFWQ
jgi:hypothetical protein